MHVVFISSMVLIQSYLNAALCRCEYIKNFPGLGKDEKLFKYKWLFKILLLFEYIAKRIPLIALK